MNGSMPVTGTQTAATTASWTSATTVNTAASLTVSTYNTVTVAMSNTSTMTNGVLTFEVSPDNTNWFPVALARIDSYTVETTYTLNTVAARAWSTSVDGFTNFRVRLSTVITGSGTASLWIAAQTMPIEPIVSVGQATAASLNATVVQGTAANLNANVSQATAANLNATVNVSQINGVAATMGNGASGTGVQRVTIASDSTANIATIGTSVVPGTAATNLGKAEDAVAGSGDTGVAVFAVRRDTPSSDVSGAGDYATLQVDSLGRLWTAAIPRLGLYRAAAASAHTTSLNSLANATMSAASSAIDNSSNGDANIDLEIVLAAQAVARTTAQVSVYLISALDGTNYSDLNATGSLLLYTWTLTAATAAQRQFATVRNVIPPGLFELGVYNNTGQTFAASGNTLKYRTF